MASINWQVVVDSLDRDPRVTSPAGTLVLSQLVFAGRQYDAAGKPGPFGESSQHQAWARLLPSGRLGVTEPPYLEGAAYTHPFAPSLGGYKPQRHPAMPDGATTAAKAAYAFWVKKDQEIANRFVISEIVRLAREANAGLPLGPTNGAIQSGLESAISAAQAFLAA